jgi:hypothetical protein
MYNITNYTEATSNHIRQTTTNSQMQYSAYNGFIKSRPLSMIFLAYCEFLFRKDSAETMIFKGF